MRHCSLNCSRRFLVNIWYLVNPIIFLSLNFSLFLSLSPLICSDSSMLTDPCKNDQKHCHQITLLHLSISRVSISCPLCELGNIREGKPIRMEAVCPECAGNPLVVYKWTLSVVLGYPRVREWNPIRCMNPGNSKFELWRQQNTSQARDWMNSITGQEGRQLLLINKLL